MTAMTQRFASQAAVVTGGATGIGGAIAECLTAEGAEERAARIQANGAIAACPAISMKSTRSRP